MGYKDQVKELINEVIEELSEIYKNFESLLAEKEITYEIKDLRYERGVFVTNEGKSLEKQMNDIMMFWSRLNLRTKQDQNAIDSIILLLEVYFGSDEVFTSNDYAIIGKMCTLFYAGIIEDYFKQIVMKIALNSSKSRKAGLIKGIENAGLWKKEQLVLEELGIKSILFEELKIQKNTPYYNSYEKFRNDRNLVHGVEAPHLDDQEISILTKHLNPILIDQIENDPDFNSLSKSLFKKFIRKMLKIVTFLFYIEYQTIPYLLILDHCYNFWKEFYGIN